MKLLISTSVGDEHALAVDIAMRERGHQVVRWFAADCPSRQTQSFMVGLRVDPFFEARDAAGELWRSDEIDVAWFRRHAPASFSGLVQTDRLEEVRATWLRFHTSFRELFPDTTRWVNDPQRQELSESKLAQLRVARQVGLPVPDTLITNDPEAARHFVEARKGHVLFKPLIMMQRSSGGRTTVSRAVRIGVEHLRHDTAIRIAPSIFQQEVAVKLELRVTVMGSTVVAASIRDRQGDAILDWRNIPRERRKIEPHILPKDIHNRCIEFVRAMGLSFSTLDLILDSEGSYIFLESNPSGQFLWVEQANPDIPMLRTFCDHLEAMSLCSSPIGTTQPRPLAEVLGSHEFRSGMAADVLAHRPSNSVNVVERVSTAQVAATAAF